MASPVNFLDKFVTLSIHYELHVANSWPKLKEVETVDHNDETSPTQATNTLLINTRKDAHQHIDNIKFHYLGPSIEPSGAMHPIGLLSMDVIEPNGTSFIEKIQNVQTQYEVTNLMAGLIFGLKIFFVGRLADGSIDVLPFSKIIPMHISTLDAKFTNKGGEYHLTFNLAGSAAVSTSLQPDNGLSRAIAFTNKNVTFNSSTVQDAISKLEQKLNQNYKDQYATELKNVNGSKPLVYKINLDKELSGNLHLSSKENFGDKEPSQLIFSNTTDIASMIRSILYASKEINELIAGGKDGIYKEFHPNVRLPIIKCSYLLGDAEVTVTYDVGLYNGGKTDQNTFEFDYYFSGKNVDVIDFEVRFPSMINWMSSSTAGTNLHANNDSKIPSEYPGPYSKNTTHPDTTRTNNYSDVGQQKPIPAKKGDPAFASITNQPEDAGFSKYQAHAVPAARLAFETISLACSAVNYQMAFTIRGHYQILERIIIYPEQQPGQEAIGIDNGAWVKVNIFNQDGSAFFYTGFYRIIGVENIFSGGKFTQHLTVMMMDRT